MPSAPDEIYQLRIKAIPIVFEHKVRGEAYTFTESIPEAVSVQKLLKKVSDYVIEKYKWYLTWCDRTNRRIPDFLSGGALNDEAWTISLHENRRVVIHLGTDDSILEVMEEWVITDWSLYQEHLDLTRSRWLPLHKSLTVQLNYLIGLYKRAIDAHAQDNDFEGDPLEYAPDIEYMTSMYPRLTRIREEVTRDNVQLKLSAKILGFLLNTNEEYSQGGKPGETTALKSPCFVVNKP